MKKAFLLLFAGSIVYGQLSPTTVNSAGIYHTMPAYFYDIAVTGSGTPSVGTCAGNATLCSALHFVAAANVVHVYYDLGTTYFSMAVGNYSSTIPITLTGGTCAVSCTLTVNYAVVSHTRAVATSIKGAFGGSSSNPNYDWNELQAVANSRPGGTYNLPSTLGAPVDVDPNFGGNRTFVAGPARIQCKDVIGSEISADHSLVLTCSPSGGIYATKTNGTGDIGAFSGNGVIQPTDNMNWDPRPGNNTLWYTHINAGSGLGEIHTLTTPGFVDTLIYTSPDVGGLANSNDANITPDGYWPFIINPRNSATTAAHLWMYNVISQTMYGPFDYSGIVGLPTPFNFGPSTTMRGIIQCSTTFDANGDIYCSLEANQFNANAIVSFNKNTHTFTNRTIMPQSPEGPSFFSATTFFGRQVTNALAQCNSQAYCLGSIHSAWANATVAGVLHHYFIYQMQPLSSGSAGQWIVAMDPVSNVANMAQSVESGGTATWMFPANSQNGDLHIGCASAAPFLCLLETDTDPAVKCYWITGVTPGASTVLTLNTPYTGSLGDDFLVNGVGGITGMSGITVCPNITNISGSTITCSLATSGTYTANTGTGTTNTPFYNNTSNQNQSLVMLIDLRTVGTKSVNVTLLVKHRSALFNGNPQGSDRQGAGYISAQSTISPDGTMWCGVSNGGVPDNYNFYCGATGYSPAVAPLTGKSVISGKQVFQ